MKKIRFQLREGVSLVDQGEDFYLLSEFPLVAVKLNKSLFGILSELKQTGSLSCLPERDRPVVDLLERLVKKGLLTEEEIFDIESYPSVTIIVPVKDRPRDIEDCLRSLTSLDYPKDKLEIIVVDDGSTDSTGEAIQPFEIGMIHLTESIGASACRNLAAQKATGDLLAFTDSDCVAEAHWLKELVPFFEEEAVGIVGGYVSNFYHRSLLDRYEEVKSSLNMGTHSFRIEAGQGSNAYVPSCNLIVRKKAFAQAGGFQEDLTVGEDVDLCWRIRESGPSLLYLPQGRIDHKHRNSLVRMLKRRSDYGTSEAILYLRHKDHRKMLYLPTSYFIFYASICLGMILQYPVFYLVGLGSLFVDYLQKKTHLRRNKIDLGSLKIFSSVLRSYFSFSYHTSSYLVRYYLIFLIPCSIFYPKLWPFVVFLLIFSSLVDFTVKRPKMNFLFFLFFYTLEQLAYQTGVFLGCIKNKSFMSYVPVIHRTGKS